MLRHFRVATDFRMLPDSAEMAFYVVSLTALLSGLVRYFVKVLRECAGQAHTLKLWLRLIPQ